VTVSLDDAVRHLHRVAVEEAKATSPARLDVLADYCVQELELRGLEGGSKEVLVDGIGRGKKWDVAWRHGGKTRLAVSLKSLLKNIPGTVPNRIDDLMGEVANVQLYSPEIVVGYVMLFDSRQNAWSRKHGASWLDFLRSRLTDLSGRRPPAWAPGTIEAFVVAEIELGSSPRLKSEPDDFAKFFDELVQHVRFRNPEGLS